MLNEKLIFLMTEFDAGDPGRIQHFMKVYEYAHLIGTAEKVDPKKQRVLEIAAILHDIGIIPCEKKYGHCNGKMQEEEGPQYARELLSKVPEVTEEEIERVCYLIAHHHTYVGVDDIDYRILLEADFLVNAYEGKESREAIETFRANVFRTETGIKLLNITFNV